MDRYGIDRPDLRYGLEFVNIAEPLAGSGFQVFAGALQSGGQIKAIRVPGKADMTRREIDEMTEIAKTGGAKGLAYIGFTGEELRSPIAKFLSPERSPHPHDDCAEDGDHGLHLARPARCRRAFVHIVRTPSETASASRTRIRSRSNWIEGFPL